LTNGNEDERPFLQECLSKRIPT